MSEEFWSSQARVARTSDIDVQPNIGEGNLSEMVEMFLAQPTEQREHLRLTGEQLDQPLGLAEVQELHRREDFPGAY